MKKNYILSFILILTAALVSAQVTLPHYESFSYTVAANLGDQTNWNNYSGTDNPIDVVADNLSYSGLAASSGNAINMVAGFVDSQIEFTEVTSGEVYASFLVKVTDISNITDFTDGGYFAIFGPTTTSFSSRFWVRPATNPAGSTIDFALTNSSSGSGFGQVQNVNDVVLVVMSYNVDTGVTNGWVNPSSSDFGAGSAPTPDFTATDSSPDNINRFMLRQDSTGETPNMVIDELRLGTTWASVTPSGAVNTDPTLVINSPSNGQVFDGSTTEVPVTMTIQNFTLSADDGMGGSDGSGDGYIKTTLEETGQPNEVANFFTTMPPAITVVAGRSYTATAELVDNSGNSLTPAVTASVSFSVELPCDIQLGTITEVCDASTVNTDTYTTTIPFTQGNTTTYTITALDGSMNPVGTIGGDDPSSTASGNITISGVPEGTDFTVKVVGGSGSSCDLTRNISSPTCLSLPIYEPFDYTANMNLISNPLWQDASTSTPPNDIQVVANDDGGGNPILGSFYGPTDLPPFTGNMVSLVANGSDPFIGFSDVTSGTVYASFTFHVTDMSNAADPDGGYFAVFTEDGSFRGRIWIVDTNPGEGLTYNLGLSTTSGSSSSIHTGFTANIAEPVFVVIGYDVDNDEAKLWVVPDATTFGTNTPPAANVTLATSATAKINRFLLRQDSTNETPAIDVDELRIGTTWADVTSNPTASVGENHIDGFAAYPNPVRGNGLTITTDSSDKKEVQIYNVLGRRVFTETFTSNRKTIDISEISAGIYILKVIEGNRIATQKIIKE